MRGSKLPATYAKGRVGFKTGNITPLAVYTPPVGAAMDDALLGTQTGALRFKGVIYY